MTKARVLILLACILLHGCSQLPKEYLGQWEGDDRATMGIMGDLKITRDKISFGNGGDLNAPACSASYSLRETPSANRFTLNLQDKQCDYQRALNPGHLKDMNTLTLYLSRNPFGTRLPYANQSMNESEKPCLFIQSYDGGTDFRFTRVE